MFSTDKQTLDDLNVFGKHGGESVFSLFNRCSTRGGEALLEEMFLYPLSDTEAINKRSKIIAYLSSEGVTFPFNSNLFDALEPYLSNTDERTRVSSQEQSLKERISNLVSTDIETAMIQRGVVAMTELIGSIKAFISSAGIKNAPLLEQQLHEIGALLKEGEMEGIDLSVSKAKRSPSQMASFDALFRFKHRNAIQKLLRHIYLLDVYISVGRVAKEGCFTFPKALSKGELTLYLKGVYHPMLKGAIANDLKADKDSNIIFLTGANMAGKSTLMKSLSLALYLAHMGFPVPAEAMEFSALDGIYTTINLPDNLDMGASHFYAEVLRVKKMAGEVRSGKRLFILFDELFRGTNVKDAYEATIAITESFAGRKGNLFVLSTHIIEAGEVLKRKCTNIQTVYMPTIMKGTGPIYTYKLRHGITDDRHGMVIIRNAGILDILEKGLQNNSAVITREEVT